jgi:hypothetical protein
MKGPWSLAAGLLLGGLVGCSSTASPNWVHPGTTQAQQARALRYDPYPENDAGLPLAGDRPREYDKPPPEPSRARWQLGNWGQ